MSVKKRIYDIIILAGVYCTMYMGGSRLVGSKKEAWRPMT